MPILNITLTFNSVNTSAQVGDVIYYTPPPATSTGGFDSAPLVGTQFLGSIVAINGNAIVVEYNSPAQTAPPAGAYISFVKDKRVNTSSLLGYYADVKFINNSTDKAELFSIGSEVSQSSK